MQKKFWLIVWMLVALFGVGMLYPLNYYILKPGSAYDLTQYVEVENADTPSKGKLNMMTVSMGVATPFSYVAAKVSDEAEIMTKKEVLGENETKEDYNTRQLHLMTDSQFNAKYVAFQKADLPYEVQYKGVYVTQVVAQSAADGILQTGDEIMQLNDRKIKKHDELTSALAKMKDGDAVKVVIKRDRKTMTKTMTLKEIPNADGKIGLGIAFDDSKSIQTTPTVKIDAEDIGGPSAGLMFTLEIIDQLTKGDLTKGYNIAGTGEMNEDGTVGRIGGIDKKVIAAERSGAEILFAPDDDVSVYQKLAPKAHIVSNYEEAKKIAKKHDLKIKIVPVKTVDDALQYLEKLPPKK